MSKLVPRRLLSADQFKYRLASPEENSSAAEDMAFEVARSSVADGCINVGPRNNIEFASYTHYLDGSRNNHLYYSSLCEKFDEKRELLSFEVYGRLVSTKRPFFRFFGSPLDDSIRLESGESLYYRFIEGDEKTLVVYFDYSRLVSESIASKEYCPPFHLKTKKSKLIIGNLFGYWGTFDLFDSSGNFIVPHISLLIQNAARTVGAERIITLGGSQGGIAALVYGACVPTCSAIYSVVPTQVDRFSLRHIEGNVKDDDLRCVDSLIRDALRKKPVHMFSTVGDERLAYHQSLADAGAATFETCPDHSVKHGDCLRHFIKTIYERIENT